MLWFFSAKKTSSMVGCNLKTASMLLVLSHDCGNSLYLKSPETRLVRAKINTSIKAKRSWSLVGEIRRYPLYLPSQRPLTWEAYSCHYLMKQTWSMWQNQAACNKWKRNKTGTVCITLRMCSNNVNGIITPTVPTYRQVSNIKRTQSKNINVSRLVLQLSLPNLLKPGVKLRMTMYLEQRRQARLQLHLNDQKMYCLLRCALYLRLNYLKQHIPNI